MHYAGELTAWAAWALRKRPLVISCLGGDVLFDEQGSPGFVRRWLTKRALLDCDHVTVVSDHLGEIVQGFGVPISRIEKVVWGVDSNVFHPLGVDLEMPESFRPIKEGAVLFSPRQLKPLYNQHLMIEALPKVLEQFPDTLLVVSTFGEDDTYKAELIARINDFGVKDRVRFVPSMNAKEMCHAYNTADIVLSLAHSDGMPVSVLEAMACGTPVIATNLERLQSFFDHGRSVKFTDLESTKIADAILALLREPSLIESYSVEGRRLVEEKADLVKETQALENIFARLVRVNGIPSSS